MAHSSLATNPWRFESDFELEVELADGCVRDAWCKNIRYFELENALVGRGALDGLVFTPRLSGVYGTAHLLAAVEALEMICGVTPPENAILVRTLAVMVEHIQSDLRHSILVFMKDYLNPCYANLHFYPEAQKRYQPFQGKSVVETLRMTKKLIEIIAVVGGQWPNSAFMVPGGISGKPSYNDLVTCRYILNDFCRWYEERILGCSLERWQAVQSEQELQQWMNEKEAHFVNELGIFIRFAHLVKLHDLGITSGCSLSFPQYSNQCEEILAQYDDLPKLLAKPYSVYQNSRMSLNQSDIAESVHATFCRDYAGSRHPFFGETHPQLVQYEIHKYSFDKAPRYGDQPAETGPLAEMLASRDPLFLDLVEKRGANAYVRSLARLVRPARLLPVLKKIIDAISSQKTFYHAVRTIPDGRGYGLVSASRGALGHWLEIKNEEIAHYQIISPEVWNRSPRDHQEMRGPIEEAVIGTVVKDMHNPVELYHVLRSFDCCHACSVYIHKS